MKAKILAIIDDQPEMEDIYFLILEPLILQGLVQMKFFEDSRDFLQWLGPSEQNTPDLIFCDINMPYMDGIALCRRLRQESSTGLRQNMQIVLVSGDHPREHVDEMKELGISHYISKAASPTEILQLCLRENVLQEAIS